MLILRGAPALSAFRHGKLLAQLTDKVPAVSGLYAEFAHFAEVSGTLGADEQQVLARLLKYGPSVPVQEPAGRLFLVVPRFGTISPWSSKASDIVRNCGLEKIQRIERGIAYYVEGELSDADAGLVAAALHDRMTQLVLEQFEAAADLFSHAQPKPLRAIDVLGGGRAALEEAHKARLTDHVIEYGGKPVASVKKAIERLAKDTGIPVSPHVLRHTCAVWMAQADVPMQKISQYLGHTSMTVTVSTYARYSPSFMADAGAAAEF